METIDDTIKKNQIAEGTEVGDVVDQAKLFAEVDKIVKKTSIANRCSDIQPLKGPLGFITGISYDKTADKLKVEKNTVEAKTEIIKTEFTIETLQDMKNIYGESFYEVLAHYLVDALTYKIDEKYISMVSARAKPTKNLAFAGVDFNSSLWAVGQSILINVSKSLNDLPFSDNRSSGAFAIVNSDVASLISFTVPMNNFEASSAEENRDATASYLGSANGIDIFVDFTNDNSGTEAVLCGIKGNGISKGSTIMSPYIQSFEQFISPEDGEKRYLLRDRTAMTVNPIDNVYFEEGNVNKPSAFLAKFDVDLSDLTIYQ